MQLLSSQARKRKLGATAFGSPGRFIGLDSPKFAILSAGGPPRGLSGVQIWTGAIAFILMPFRTDFRSDAAARLGRPSDPAGGRRRLSPPVDWNGASCRGRDGARQGRMRPDRGHERHYDRQRHQLLSRVEVRAEEFPARARGRIAAKAPARLSARQPPSLKAFWDLQSLNSCLTTSRHGIIAGTKRRAPRPFSMRSTGSSHDRPMDEICSSA